MFVMIEQTFVLFVSYCVIHKTNDTQREKDGGRGREVGVPKAASAERLTRKRLRKAILLLHCSLNENDSERERERGRKHEMNICYISRLRERETVCVSE
jgi:hypothetical protein